MASGSPYIKKQVTALQGQVASLLGVVRQSIEDGAGFAVEPGSVRVRRRELEKAVVALCLDTLPKTTAEMMKVLATEPSWLDRDIEFSSEDGNSSMKLLTWLRREMADDMAAGLSQSVYKAVMGQFKDEDFASVIREIRVVIGASEDVGKKQQEALEKACSVQEQKKVPSTRAILPELERLRYFLADAGKSGDQSKLVLARVLMEMADFMDASGYLLDKTHVLPIASTHSPGL